MKKPIAWHKECLKNRWESIERMRDEWYQMMKRLEDYERWARFLSQQIEAAEKAGRDGFDADKFMHSRK